MRHNHPNGIVISACVGLVQLLIAHSAIAQDSLNRDYSDQLQRIAPREPNAAIQSMEINDELRIELIVSEPMVMDPVAITFDEWGRAYVVEMRGYSEREDQRLGRIKLLEDTDNDGRFDKSVIFADKFRWPTAIVYAFGGVLVGDAPHLVFLKDIDGDRSADVRQVLFTGFGTSNVQQLPNSFQWGIDNQIYGASGGNGGQLRRVEISDALPFNRKNVDPSQPINLNGRDFKIDPKTLSLAAIAGGTQFGMTFDRFGRRYICSNSDHCQQIIFEDKYAVRNELHRFNRSRINIAVDGPAAEVFRISPVEPWRKVRTRLRVQGLVAGPIEGGGRAAGYFTSATGITCYNGDLLPQEYVGNLFVGDVGSNLVHRKKLVGQAIQKQAVRTELNSEFLRSPDNWFRPVQMANAPDGSLIMLDMYRETIEHPASLPQIIKKHLDLNSGNQRGRIYRILPENSFTRKRLLPGQATSRQLVNMLSHPNGWHRQTAARVLFEKSGSAKEALSIAEMIRANGANSGLTSSQPETRIRAMHLLSEIDEIRDDELASLLNDKHPQVRIHALRLAESQLSSELEKQIIDMTGDPDVQVRFQVALTLGELGCETRNALTGLAVTDGLDPWMQIALASSAFRNRGEVIQCLLQKIGEDQTSLGNCKPLLLELTGQLARKPTDQDLELVAQVLEEWPLGNELLLGELISQLMRMPDPRLKELRILLGKTGVMLDQLVARATSQARLAAVDRSLALQERVVAIKVLVMDRPEAVAELVKELLELIQGPAIKLAAIELAGQFESVQMGEVLLGSFRSLNPDLRSAALQALLSRESWALQLLAHIESGKISPVLVDAVSRQRLMRHPDQIVQARAKKLLGTGLNPDRAKLSERYLVEIDQFEGNVERGRDLFRKVCMSCHRLEKQGTEIGPNLAAFVNRGTAAMVTNIIDPNREVDPRYLSYQVRLEDGRTLLGMIGNETATTISLQNSEGKSVAILRDEIEEVQSTTLSLMPENLDNEISPEGMADLIEYLLSQGG